MVSKVERCGPTSRWGSRSFRRGALVALVGALTACGSGSVAPATPVAVACDAPAELVLLGGTVMTMTPDRPTATALAITGNVIVAVGSDADMRPFIGEGTRVIALEGRSVTPGLVDGHAHLYGLGRSLASVSLRGLDSEQAAAAAVGAAAGALPQGDWVTGRGWDQTLWSPANFPDKASLDAVVSDRPVFVRRVDGHAGWANSQALALAGVTGDTPDPAGGRIVRDAAGAPTGVLVDNAMDLVESKIPAPSAAARRAAIQAAAKLAVSVGLTGVHEMGISDETAAVYRELAADGELPLRVYAFLAYEPGMEDELETRKRYLDDGDSVFVLRAIKLFADGALGSRGAALLAPYSDDPGNTGLVITDAAKLAHVAERAAAAGWQVGVHAIGDRANRETLDAFERAMAAHPDVDARFRVEHAQVLAAEDIPRFAALGVLASMQPTHCTSDMRWAQARLGDGRVEGAYAWRRVLDAGGRIVAGSDFPVEGVSPLLGVYAAVTRQDADGTPDGGWYPEQRLTLDEALRSFTVEPAFGAFAEARRGRLTPGYLADVTVFDRTLAADGSLLSTGVEMTLLGGRAVHISAWAGEKLAATAPADILCR